MLQPLPTQAHRLGMLTGPKEKIMGIKTRLDGRSEDNFQVSIVNSESGESLAEISIAAKDFATLEINTKPGHHLEKLNGWSSKKE